MARLPDAPAPEQSLPEPQRNEATRHEQTLVLPQRRIDRRMSSLIAAFRYAFAGLWYLLRTQRNAQIHCLVAACAIALGAVLGLERWEWLVLVLTIALVLAAEGVNTAVEAAVDVATSTYHPLARIAKDVGAGTVLLCAIASVIVGCLIFIPHLWPVLMQLANWW